MPVPVCRNDDLDILRFERNYLGKEIGWIKQLQIKIETELINKKPDLLNTKILNQKDFDTIDDFIVEYKELKKYWVGKMYYSVDGNGNIIDTEKKLTLSYSINDIPDFTNYGYGNITNVNNNVYINKYDDYKNFFKFIKSLLLKLKDIYNKDIAAIFKKINPKNCRDILKNNNILKDEINKLTQKNQICEDEKKKALSDKQKCDSDKQQALADKQQAITEKQKCEDDKRQIDAQRKTALAEKNQAIAEKQKCDADKKQALADKQKCEDDKLIIDAQRKTALADKKQALDDKQQALADKKQALDDKQQALADKQQAIAEKQQAEDEKKILNQENTKLNDKIKNLDKQLQDLNTKYNDLNKQRDLLQQRYDDLDKKYQQLLNQSKNTPTPTPAPAPTPAPVQQTPAPNTNLQQKLNQCENDKNLLNKQIQNLNAQIDKMQKDYNTLKKDRDNIEKDRKHLQTRIDELETKLDECEKKKKCSYFKDNVIPVKKYLAIIEKHENGEISLKYMKSIDMNKTIKDFIAPNNTKSKWDLFDDIVNKDDKLKKLKNELEIALNQMDFRNMNIKKLNVPKLNKSSLGIALYVNTILNKKDPCDVKIYLAELHEYSNGQMLLLSMKSLHRNCDDKKDPNDPNTGTGTNAATGTNDPNASGGRNTYKNYKKRALKKTQKMAQKSSKRKR